MARLPEEAAPYTMLMAATSDSDWTKTRPSLGIWRDIYSGISFWGVMGYPKKQSQPARIAA